MNYIHFDPEDVKKNALPAALGCICFPVPLIACPKSPLGRFCANQGLILLIAQLIVWAAFALIGALTGWIPLIGWLIRLAGRLIRLAIVALSLWMAWQTWQGRPMRVPYVGDITIIR